MLIKMAIITWWIAQWADNRVGRVWMLFTSLTFCAWAAIAKVVT